MADISVAVRREVGCLDKAVNALAGAGVQVESLACACPEDGSGLATFSVAARADSAPEILDRTDAQELDSSVLHVRVRNEAGCLATVTNALSRAGVTISHLACACAATDEHGIVAVGLSARK